MDARTRRWPQSPDDAAAPASHRREAVRSLRPIRAGQNRAPWPLSLRVKPKSEVLHGLLLARPRLTAGYVT